MSFIFSRALVAEFSPASFSGTDASAPSNTNPTPRPCLWHDRTMEPSRLSRFGMTCERLMDDRGAVLLMSWLAASRVRTSAQQETETVSTASAPAYGAKWPESSVRYDPASSSWKTAHCLWEEDLPWSSVTLPTWGMTRNGSVYRHPTAERPISGIGAGLWPTPTVCGNYNRKGASATSGDGLATVVTQRTWPTPNCIGFRSDGELAILAKSAKDESEYLAMSHRACNSKRMRFWPTATATAYKGWSPNHNRAMTDDRLDYSVERESFQPGQQTPPKRLNPAWVEVLMGWPNEMTSLNPISSVKMCFWLMGFCDDEETGRTQVLRVLREGNAAKEVREAIGRSVCISEAAFLLHELCEYANRPYEARIFMACAEALEEEMRSVRLYEGVTGAPHRPGQDAQRTGKHTDSMQALSRLLAHHGQKAWKNGSWEDGIPRVVDGMPHRAHRIKALGNGQVPRVAAAAFAALSGT